MNIIDVYWFFLQKAALNEDESVISFYDKANDRLFKIKNINGIVAPKMRNDTLSPDNTIKYNEAIAKYSNGDGDIYKLEAISYADKKQFLNDFLETQVTDREVREKIMTLLTPNNLADGGKIIIRIDIDLAMKIYWPFFNNFMIEKKFNEYFSLGMTENTEVLW